MNGIVRKKLRLYKKLEKQDKKLSALVCLIGIGAFLEMKSHVVKFKKLALFNVQ
jgi:hypothetical protein